jgi:hypothetical protein
MSDLSRRQSVTESMAMTIMNLVTPKVRAKHELLFNKPALAVYVFYVSMLCIF